VKPAPHPARAGSARWHPSRPTSSSSASTAPPSGPFPRSASRPNLTRSDCGMLTGRMPAQDQFNTVIHHSRSLGLACGRPIATTALDHP
jgi:hypothetical protein